jgi:hypothetical protein
MTPQRGPGRIASAVDIREERDESAAEQKRRTDKRRMNDA